MTRPWSPAEIAGAKALAAQYHKEPMEYDLTDARLVLDAAGAGLRAEVAAELEALAAQVRGAGAGEQR